MSATGKLRGQALIGLAESILMLSFRFLIDELVLGLILMECLAFQVDGRPTSVRMNPPSLSREKRRSSLTIEPFLHQPCSHESALPDQPHNRTPVVLDPPRKSRAMVTNPWLT